MSKINEYKYQYDWQDCQIINIERETTFLVSNPFIEIMFEHTLIRGDGETVEAAETEAYNQYIAIINCSFHSYERTNDSGRGQCTKCNHITNNLEDISKCKHCTKKPVCYYFYDHVCYEHYSKAILGSRMDLKKDIIYLEAIKELDLINDETEHDFVKVLMTDRKVEICSIILDVSDIISSENSKNIKSIGQDQEFKRWNDDFDSTIEKLENNKEFIVFMLKNKLNNSNIKEIKNKAKSFL